MLKDSAIQVSLPPVDELCAARSNGLKGHALYLDVDGTILDLAPEPSAVEVPSGLLSLLQSLLPQLDGAIAFVSGRTIAAIDALFAPLKLPTIGVHGGELRTPDGRVSCADQLASELAGAAMLLARAICAMPGVLLENKRSALALHYRRVPERGREVLQIAEVVARGMGSDFAVRLGKCVVEICPRRLTKGTALRALMGCAPFQGRTPIYAGDDLTDEDAFAVVNQLGGISVRVGERAPSAARYHLSDPSRLRSWLLEIART